ncbi:hypothetical protein BDN72DRAFT_960587 [Pluteus cervinus]|uniref:Uncharacterized protein n=1 Tax=Pluteus cervinus TaxID=181527 RepID=A0ACD3APW3_9AGAR|nr:hypothetical protein BDN72DRAFT_960587 [Pluteus cervinus]
MEVIISQLQRMTSLPTLCRYDISVIANEGKRNTGFGAQIQQTTIFARLLVAGQVVQVEQGSPVLREDTMHFNSWQLGGLFPFRWGPTSFAIYVGFKNSHQEGTLLEAKFHPSRFVQDGYTLDIVSSKSLQDAYSLSIEAQLFTHRQCVDISHNTKHKTTSLRITTSSDQRRESLDTERRLLQKLVDSPVGKARADALITNGFRLIPHFNLEHTDYTQYLGLAIQALSAGCAHAPNHSQSHRLPHIALCLLLFRRCTFPNGDSFVGKAFDALKRLEVITDPDNGFEESSIHSILLVLQKHARPDYVMLTFRILAPSICALAKKDQTNPACLAFSALLAIQLAPAAKETSTILDSTLAIITPLIDDIGEVLILRAAKCIDLHFSGGDIGRGVVTAAIESVQTHFLKHENAKVMHREWLGRFVGLVIPFLETPGENMTVTELTRFIAFLDWAISLGVKSVPNGSSLVERRVWMQTGLWLFFGNNLANEASQGLKEVIQFVYREYPDIGDLGVEFLEDQMFCIRYGEVTRGFVRPGSLVAMNDFLEYSLSTKPHDHTTLIRVIIGATIARTFGYPVAMKGYELLMSGAELFDFTWAILPMRDSQLLTHPRITSDAISYALASSYHDLAIEWIDQSSCLVWGRIIRFQSSFTQVAAVNSRLAEELTEMAAKLLGSPNDGGPSTGDNGRHISYVRRWTAAVEEVRKLPGLDRFFRPRVFEEIQSVVDTLGGPVVYLTINRFSCDALCVLPNLGEAIHIPLPQLRLGEVQEMGTWFRNLIYGAGTEEVHLDTDGSRKGRLVKDHKFPHKQSVRREYVSFPTILGYLWRTIVKPVLDGLAISRSELTSAKDLPRLWWCPCAYLDALPIHAAGLYNGDSKDSIMNYVVSSYILSPSLTSHITRAEATTPNPHFLAVANPSGCGLPGTEWELEIIRKHIGDAGPTTELVGTSVTPDAVKQGMQAASWVHFACHGVNVDARPLPDNVTVNGSMDSYLILANHARLTVTAISKLKLPQAQFAFLSACETAQEGLICYGESPHIAAAMLVAGFRCVVGTMWRISDYHAPLLADRFYQKMFEGAPGRVPDYRLSAYALHDAVKALRAEQNPDFRIWVPFCHFGTAHMFCTD